MAGFIITWIVTAVSLVIIARLNVGIYVSDFGQSMIAALVIGLLNAFLGPILQILALPITILTIGIFALIVNAFLFWLAASLVKGFSLQRGFWSALLGSVLLTIMNALIFWVLGVLGIG